MKQVLIIICLLITFTSFGQRSKTTIASKDIYKTLTGPSLLNSVLSEDLSDNFYISDGFAGYRLILDTNRHSFIKVNFSCMMRFMADSGSWTINNGMLNLKSSKGKQTFDVLKFDNYFILVKPNQREAFIKDFSRLAHQYKDFKPFQFEGEEPWSKERVIGYNLKNKYFIREICE